MFDHPSDRNQGRSHGSVASSDCRRPLHRAVERVLQIHADPGNRSGPGGAAVRVSNARIGAYLIAPRSSPGLGAVIENAGDGAQAPQPAMVGSQPRRRASTAIRLLMSEPRTDEKQLRLRPTFSPCAAALRAGPPLDLIPQAYDCQTWRSAP